jgi:hypothetical protein
MCMDLRFKSNKGTVALLLLVWEKWTRGRLKIDWFNTTIELRRFHTVGVGRFLPGVLTDFQPATVQKLNKGKLIYSFTELYVQTLCTLYKSWVRKI